MKFRQIQYFIAVAEAQSLTKATERLHIAQPALSQNIKALETDLGAALFTRSRLGVTLTDAGSEFLSHAYEIMRQIERARASVQGLPEDVRGSVKIAAPASVCNVLAVPVQKAVAEQYPGVELTMEEGLSGTLAAAFKQGLFDVLVDFDVEESDDVRVEPLIKEQLYFIHSPSMQDIPDRDFDFRNLRDHQIVLPRSRHGLARAVTGYAERMRIKLRPGPRIGSMHTAIKLVRAGLGCGVLPWSAIYDSLDSSITAHKIVEPMIYRTVQMVTSVSRPRSSAMLCVMGVIREAVNEAHSNDTWRGELLLQRSVSVSPAPAKARDLDAAP